MLMTAPETPMIVYWCGEPINDMTREKLIEALCECGRQLEVEREMHRASLSMFSLAAQARRSRP